MEIKDELLDLNDIKHSKKSLLDLFIRRTAVVEQVSEDLVDLIVRDQWRNALKQTQPQSSTSEIDFAKLGLFYLSPSKGKRRLIALDKLENKVRSLDPVLDPKTINRRNIWINKYILERKTIKQKLKLDEV